MVLKILKFPLTKWFLLIAIYLLYVVNFVKLPELYLFATDSNAPLLHRLLNAPIHLQDDVMISLRAGENLIANGAPRYNLFDLAQPSTSYLAPYLFAFLRIIFSSNFAIFLYAFLGFLSVSLVLFMIFTSGKSKVLSSALVCLLMISTTFKEYSFNGWDHNFQSFFLCTATFLLIFRNGSKIDSVLIGFLLFLGIGFRPDSAILVVGILVALFIKYRSLSRSVLASTAFIVPFLILLISNYQTFGNFTPTTSRLKLGRPFSLNESLSYLKREWLAFSSITLLIFCLVVLIISYKHLPRFSFPILLGVIVNFLYSSFVTDVFNGGRMFWTPLVISFLMFSAFVPSPVSFRENPILNPELFAGNANSTRFKNIKNLCLTVVTLLIVLVPIFKISYFNLAINESVVREENLTSTSAQYGLTRWIDKNLDPKNGPIGYFWLGVAYHLPNFEAADFLGKSDEMIARSNPKWGPPGHNKWNISKTISKWNPQLILPPEADMFRYTEEFSRNWIETKSDWGFVPELRLNRSVNDAYLYCTLISTSTVGNTKSYGFYLRNDLVRNFESEILCKK